MNYNKYKIKGQQISDTFMGSEPVLEKIIEGKSEVLEIAEEMSSTRNNRKLLSIELIKEGEYEG